MALDIEFGHSGDGPVMMLGDSDEDVFTMDAGIKQQNRMKKKREKRLKKKLQRAARAPVNEDFSALGDVPEDVDDENDEEPDQGDGGGSDFDEDDAASVEELATPVASSENSNLPSPGYRTVDEEKVDLLNKLERLSKKGHTIRPLNMYSSLEDVRNEYKRVSYSIEIETGLRFSRRMLITCVTGLEYMNTTFNPLDVNLEGWAEATHTNIDDYDSVLEELIVKYRGAAKMAPELRLLLMLGGSAATHHITHSMFKSLNVADILKQNPGLKETMVNAAVKTTQGAASEGGPPDVGNLMSRFMNPPQTVSSRPDRIQENTVVEERAVEEDELSVSDIVSEADTVTSKEIGLDNATRRRKGKGKTTKNILTM